MKTLATLALTLLLSNAAFATVDGLGEEAKKTEICTKSPSGHLYSKQQKGTDVKGQEKPATVKEKADASV